MPLSKQPVAINFMRGLDTKDDPNFIEFGKFTSFVNSVFDTIGRVTKRNGFPQLPGIIGSTSYLTTYNGNLAAIGSNIQVYAPQIQSWTNVSPYIPIQLSTTSLIKNMYSQTQVDTAIAPNGLMCVVCGFGDFPPTFRYSIVDSVSGQAVVPATQIPTNGVQLFSPRVFTLGTNFVIVGDSGSQTLQMVSIPSVSPTTVGSISVVSSAYAASQFVSFDGVVASNSLYLSWNTVASAGIKASIVRPDGTMPPQVSISSSAAQQISVCADITSAPIIWTTGNTYNSSSIRFVSTDTNLVMTTPRVSVTSSGSMGIVNTTMTAQNGVMTAYVEGSVSYLYDSTVPTNSIDKISVQQNGATGTEVNIARSLGIASKAFFINSSVCFLSAYQSPLQSTYFLINSTGQVLSKLAYSNGGGYLTSGLPSVTVVGSTASVGYLVKDFITSTNKLTLAGLSSVTQTSGIYAQTGINQANFNFTNTGIISKEIGQALNINGGFLGMYDGTQFVENNFFLFPDSVEVVSSSIAGGPPIQTYSYIATYEWTDSQGNIHRSAPSIPVLGIPSAGAQTNFVSIPTPRITYKTTTNPIRLKLYRWSVSQPVYFLLQSTVMTSNTLGNDSITLADTKVDGSIVGNEILYTNGGVVEDINGPAATAMTLWDDRLWMITAEDQNLLWYSKQIIENTPVEMSDLFTLYVPPSVGAEGPTGIMKCLHPMDDKLIISKKNAFYYINGVGPDNTGANSQYSQPIFITSAVGCSNQKSMVTIPAGTMFQSDKGIWLLGRDLSTSYIGKEVEAFNSATVLSALTIPGTNQVRFTLNTGVTLLYDYLVNQWGAFNGIPGVSSTLYNNLHTYVNSSGSVFQETVGTYYDGIIPVSMSFTTGWANLAGLQGYKRIYKSYLLGNYKSPHTFSLGVAHDFDPTIIQTINVTPDPTKTVEQWQLNFNSQQCQSFQLSFNESYDGVIGSSITAGAGLTISGMTMVVGTKQGFPGNIPANQRKS